MRARQRVADEELLAAGANRFVQYDELDRAIGVGVDLLNLECVKRGVCQ